jgi:hypothetical protein
MKIPEENKKSEGPIRVSTPPAFKADQLGSSSATILGRTGQEQTGRMIEDKILGRPCKRAAAVRRLRGRVKISAMEVVPRCSELI